MAPQLNVVDAAEALLASIKAYDRNDAKARASILKLIDRIRYMIEDSRDTIMRQWQSVHLTAAIDVLKSTGTLEVIPKDGTATASELAHAVGVEESVITRTMRMLCGQGIAEEPRPNEYTHNEKSLAYIPGQPIASFFDLVLDQEFALRKLPGYLKTHSVAEFLDLRKSPYAFAQGKEGKTFYEVLSEDPARLKMFNQVNAFAENMFTMTGMFPFANMKAEVQAEPERAFIVDVGGGRGSTLVGIQKEAPQGFGSDLILQDRPDVLSAVADEDIPHITKMPHDFFTPQPVQNAHLYLIRRCLHNYYPDVCVQILRNIASAMGPTSRLLICDAVIPERTQLGEDSMIDWMDFSMMAITGREKTEKDFQEIADGAGLYVAKIWPQAFEMQSIVEMKLKNRE